MRGKSSFVVAILVLSSVLLSVSVAEEEPPGPPEQPPYIKHWTVNPPWSYKDSIIYFWCHYVDSENRTIDSANIFIDNISYPLWENSTSENPTAKNFVYQAEQPWERKTYEFYFEITTGLIVTQTSKGYFEIVNREPYLLETPPVKMEVAEEFEWDARAFDPDLDYITWNYSSNMTGWAEWEWEPNNTTAKLKIKCQVAAESWINVSIRDNYTGLDYWNWTLRCYSVGQEKIPPPIPRGEKHHFRLGVEPPSTSGELLPEVLLAATFRPDGDGHEIDWTPKGGGNNFVEVDEAVTDEDGTYVSIAKGNEEDYYDIADHGAEAGVITNVRVTVRAKQTGAEEIDVCVYTVLTEDCGAAQAVGAGYGDITEDWANNPTGGAWTWAQIDALQIGQKSDAVGGWGGTMYVTQVYATVTYNAPAVTVFYWHGAVDANWDTAGNWEPTSSGDYPKDNGDSAIFGTWNAVCTIQDGVAVTLTIGYLQINATYASTITSAVKLILDSGGTENGTIAGDGGTWNMNSADVNIDGQLYIGDGLTVSNPARVTFQGGITQNLQSNGEALYQGTVDNVAGTILYLLDDAEFFDITIGAAGTFEIDAISEGTSLTLEFTDAANCGFISTSSGQLTFQGDGVNGVTITTADAAPPPTNRWSNSGYNIKTDATYTTFSYFSIYRISDFGDTITNSLFDQYNDEVEITQNPVLTDDTFDNGFDTAIFETDCNRLTNLVITNAGRNTIVVTTNVEVEMVDSNFDDSGVDTSGSGERGVISETHNDTANRWVIVPAGDWLLSSVINKPGTGDNVEIMRPISLSADHDFIINANIQLETVLVRGFTSFQIGADTPAASRTLTFDDAVGAGFDANSAGLIRGSGTNANPMTITNAAPHTNDWQCNLDTGNPDFTFDWTTLTYGTRCRSSGSWDLDNTTFDFFDPGQHIVTIEVGSTITNFNNVTFSDSGGAGQYGFYNRIAHDQFYNIVIATFSDSQVYSRNVKSEFAYSNFDPVFVVSTAGWPDGEVISTHHNDSSTHYLIVPEALSLSAITQRPTAAMSIQIFNAEDNDGAFTIDEDLDFTNMYISEFIDVTHNAGTFLTITGLGNLTINGSLASSDIIRYSGAEWYAGFVNYYGGLFLNDSTMSENDMVISFPFMVGGTFYGAVNELNITQPAGADNSVNITQRDFSVKGSGTVLTFIANNSANVNTHYTVTNLTTGEAYNVDVNGTTEYTIDATGSQIGFSYLSEGDRIIEITWSANISGRTPGEDGGPIPVTYAGFTYKVHGDRWVCFDSGASFSQVGILSYYWDFGDGNDSHQENPCHRYQFSVLESKYRVTLTVVDKFRHQNSSSKDVTASNWNFYLGIGLILTMLIGVMVQTTMDKPKLREKFRWRNISSRTKEFFR